MKKNKFFTLLIIGGIIIVIVTTNLFSDFLSKSILKSGEGVRDAIEKWEKEAVSSIDTTIKDLNQLEEGKDTIVSRKFE